ncbi:UDP-N-acetylglucosamine 2-epimerase (non-hydrolysing) [Antricoccus suffuscus]|uniref:UDP-N-acetylglucosamine 2-epimerase (non-hydrolyzing) n=1 Tax=Antricoccus suffuscus TaxID=1629062 RepID=A0A2T1A1P9_9ACTN|nr:UDP-N-acetylglucosamine 2-epimerase (non-hydrolyzing) [Antricoccus suffuscus]PRZ42513.1 UDP-N-acetylglucosamine 2-epimerase (non-hydrolysing) [Antricoccus suffuscus]
MLRVMTIYGTRPEAIKMAPLVEALARQDDIEPIVAVTGQHREMLDQVNAIFNITPDHDLDLMQPGATLTQITTRALERINEMLVQSRPDAVVVQGDTTTAFAGALAAFYEQIPVVHLEAGLRTGNMRSPFPEEMNRRLTSPIAALHLAPTAISKANLLAENIDESIVPVIGNTVIDALHWTVDQQIDLSDPAIEKIVSSGRRILLITTHRRESWGAKMRETMNAVAQIARAEPDLAIVLPMHRNPIVRDVVVPILGELDNVVLTEPMAYGEFARLIAASTVILTDSGGVQEEAPSLGKPVLVMRDTTERPEAVTAGTVRLVGTDGPLIVESVLELLRDEAAYKEMANAVNPYGDGKGAPRAAAAIAQMLDVGERLPDFVVE